MLLEQVADRAAARGDQHGCVLALRRGLDLARREIFRGELDDPMRAVLIFCRKLGEALARSGDLTDARRRSSARRSTSPARTGPTAPSSSARSSLRSRAKQVFRAPARRRDYLREALDPRQAGVVKRPSSCSRSSGLRRDWMSRA